MAIRMRRGLESELDISKALPGEWLVSTDTKYVRMCFAPGIVLRMATYEAFEADMDEIRDIVSEARTIQEAVSRINTEIENAAVVVEDYSVMTKSYAVGGTGTRENEDVDNAKYYYEQAKHISQGLNGLIPLGTIAFENLPTEDILTNGMYNISNDFTSDERFLDGGGVQYGKGSNIYYTVNGFWDVLAASDVKGIRGAKEDLFRQGNVTLTPEDLGAASAEDLDAVNESLGKRNLQTFTELAQIGCSTNNTISEVMATLPIYSELVTGIGVAQNNLTHSLPEVKSFILICRKSGGNRGDIVLNCTYDTSISYFARWHEGTLTAWESPTTNSDLEQKVISEPIFYNEGYAITVKSMTGYRISVPEKTGYFPIGITSLYLHGTDVYPVNFYGTYISIINPYEWDVEFPAGVVNISVAYVKH